MITRRKGHVFMMVFNKTKVTTSLVLALILAASCYYYFAVYHSTRLLSFHGDYVAYSNAEDLFSAAELVVVGRPLQSFEERNMRVTNYATGAIQDFYTLTEINVEKVVKGPASDLARLQVIEPIAQIQTVKGIDKISVDGYTEMQKGSQYLIFLKKNTQGQYSVINMQSGKFNLDHSDANDFAAQAPDEVKGKTALFEEIKAKHPDLIS